MKSVRHLFITDYQQEYAGVPHISCEILFCKDQLRLNRQLNIHSVNYKGNRKGLLSKQEKNTKSRFWSTETAAKYLDVEVNYLYKLAKLRLIAFYRPIKNGKILFDKNICDDWIKIMKNEK